MRVLVANKLASFVPGRLQDLGAQVTVDVAAAGERLTARVVEVDPEVLVVRSTKVTAADLMAGRSLALVIRAGAGVNTIDIATASQRGVYVANCPGKNAIAVAELAVGHLVNLDRRLVDGALALREGRWDKKTFGQARGLAGRTLAVIGCGQIGREVITRAQALGMRIRAWSPSLTVAGATALGVERCGSIEEAVTGADAVTVHLALAKETRGRIGESVFAAMKPGAYFINTARAEVVDHEEMIAAARAKGLRLGLDVFPAEPAEGQAPFTDPVLALPHVYGSHHVGASTDEAEEAVGEEVVRIVQAYASGGSIPNCVNLAARSPATHLLVVRHADRVGVLARVLGVVSEAQRNIEDMQNIVFAGGRAAVARIGIVGALGDEALERLSADADIYSVSQVAQGG